MPSSTSAGGGIAPKVRPASAVREDRGDGPRLVLPTFMVARRGLSTIGRRASRDFPRFRDATLTRVSRTSCDAEEHGHLGATGDCAARGSCLHHHRVHGRAWSSTFFHTKAAHQASAQSRPNSEVTRRFLKPHNLAHTIPQEGRVIPGLINGYTSDAAIAGPICILNARVGLAQL